MMEELLINSKDRMQKTIESFQNNLSKIRTGRANTTLLDHISIDYYGTMTPLSQVAAINVADSSTLTIQPYEKNFSAVIEKVIRESDLGLNPVSLGDLIRVPMPPLTEERRKDLIKVVKSDGENSKVSVRNIRRDSNDELKKLIKNKEISEDEERRLQDLIQKNTDLFIVEIDSMIGLKEKDLLTI
ncbi:ribosome recycling factor [Methylophilaceae bacterium]|nr:ribosome recycling factor [Methylophilaceae bacterium]